MRLLGCAAPLARALYVFWATRYEHLRRKKTSPPSLQSRLSVNNGSRMSANGRADAKVWNWDKATHAVCAGDNPNPSPALRLIVVASLRRNLLRLNFRDWRSGVRQRLRGIAPRSIAGVELRAQICPDQGTQRSDALRIFVRCLDRVVP